MLTGFDGYTYVGWRQIIVILKFSLMLHRYATAGVSGRTNISTHILVSINAGYRLASAHSHPQNFHDTQSQIMSCKMMYQHVFWSFAKVSLVYGGVDIQLWTCFHSLFFDEAFSGGVSISFSSYHIPCAVRFRHSAFYRPNSLQTPRNITYFLFVTLLNPPGIITNLCLELNFLSAA